MLSPEHRSLVGVVKYADASTSQYISNLLYILTIGSREGERHIIGFYEQGHHIPWYSPVFECPVSAVVFEAGDAKPSRELFKDRSRESALFMKAKNQV